jgi:drug/metabolite transporter (DMT)-like permease
LVYKIPERVESITYMIYLLLIASIALAVGGQFFLKLNASKIALEPNLASIISFITKPSIFLPLGLYVLSSVLWFFVIKKLPLSVAAPSLVLSYVLLFILGITLLGEKYTAINIAGATLIVTGVFLIIQR